MGVYAPHVKMPDKCVSCTMPCKLWDYHADRPKDCPLRNVVKLSVNLILDGRHFKYPDEAKRVEMELRAKLAETLPEVWELRKEETQMWGPFGEVHIGATICVVENQGGLSDERV